MKKILLYPGGFKPFHDGHLMLLDYTLSSINIDEVYIITSNKERDKVTSSDVLNIINNCVKYLKYKYQNIQFHYIRISGSPIKECYNIINNSDINDVFSLLSSAKSIDDYNRNIIFYNEYKIGGKYNNHRWNIDKVFKLPDTCINPYIFDDSNIIISSNILRANIINNNFENFIKGYTFMLYNNIIDINNLSELFINILNKN